MSSMLAQKIIARIHTLPALSPTAVTVLQTLDNPRSTARDVAQVMLTDPVLTAQLLRLANSAYYGMARRITTVTDAATILGFQAIRSLIMTIAVHPMLSHQVPGYELQQGDLWRHSISAAVCCQRLARRVNYLPAEEAFVAGLVHDIGKVALGCAVGEQFGNVLARVRSENIDFLQAERREFGMAHDDVGAMVARHWGFPLRLEQAISYHHRWNPAKEYARLTAIVHVADALCLMLGMGVGDDGLCYRMEEKAVAALGLHDRDLQEVMTELAAQPPHDLLHVPA